MMAKSTATPKDKVIVIGASLAGLLAARALANHFEQVILLERDIFPPPGENRKGVPQGKHIHVLLERGRQIMENYLPGLTDEMTDKGAAYIADVSLNMRWFYGSNHHQPGISGVSGVGISRPTLEALIRARVLALPNVHTFEGCNVSGLATTSANGQSNRRVAGVRMINRRKGSEEETMLADLVVDASGRGSRSPAWLENIGYEPPEVEEVRIGVGYTTCYYRRKPEHLPGLSGIAILSKPPNKHLGVMLAQDGNRWVVTLGGYLGHHAPADYPGFVESAKSLPMPHIHNLIKNAERLTEPVSYTFPANLRRHYEKLSHFPEGYLVFGDALCSFSPIYGQGMTVAALEAVALDECLVKNRGNLAELFFPKARQIIDISWNAAVGSDLNFEEVEGPRTAMLRFLNWYIGKLHLAAFQDAQVSIAFLKVINMVAPPPSILHPRIVWRVLKGNLWPGRRKNVNDREVSLAAELRKDLG
jgi:2-polyprenyl-6-methoxyphenol hydroxylase-like FAD-dependent oxidoreductase